MPSLFDQPVLGGLFNVESAPEREALNMGLLGLGLGMLESGRFGPGLQNFQSLYQSGLAAGERREEKEAERKRQEQLAQAYQTLLGGAPAGGTQVADASGAAPASPGMDLTPEQRAILATLPPEQGIPILAQQAFQTPEAPKTRTVRIGNEQVTQQWNPSTGQWDEVGRGAAFRTTPDTVVNVDTAENAFAKEFGKQNAQTFFERRAAASDAAASLVSNQEARKLLDSGIISGFGADFKVALGKALQQAGFNVAEDAIANTEAFVATRAQEVGRIIKLFGAGTGLSDADREFAQKAAAGQIAMNEQSIRRILDINDRAARNVIERYNKDAAAIDPSMSPFPLTIEVPEFPTAQPSPAPAQMGGAASAPSTAATPLPVPPPPGFEVIN